MADTLSKKKHKLSCLLGLGSSLYVTFVSITSSYMVLYRWCGCLSCCCKITGGKIKTPKKSFHPLSRLINRPHYTENLSWNVSYSVKLPLHQCSQWDDMPFFGGRAIFAEQHCCLRGICITFVIFIYLHCWVLALLKSTFIAGKRNGEISRWFCACTKYWFRISKLMYHCASSVPGIRINILWYTKQNPFSFWRDNIPGTCRNQIRNQFRKSFIFTQWQTFFKLCFQSQTAS